ncbi:MAG: PAS domain-containing protein, partial [Spirochaetota bacterium]
MRVLVATSDIDGKALVSGVQSEMPETKFILITDRSQLLESLDSDVFEALVVEDGAYFDSAVQRGIIESETPCIVLCRSGSESRLNGIDDFIVVGGDTQRERSELRLRIELADRRRGTQDRERQRHEIASRALREIVYRLDQNGHFTYLNESISQLGYEESDLLGKHFSTLLENESVQQVSRDSVLPPLAGTVTNGNTPGLFDERRRGARSTRELAVLMRSGNRTTAEPVLGYVTASGDVVTHSDGTSQVVGTIGVIREATRESHSIDLLRKLYTVADSSQFGILVTDASLRVQYANPAFYRTSQLNPEQVLGTSVSEIPNEGFDEGLMSELLHGCSAEVVIERDFRTQYADGSEHEMLMVGRPVYDATHKCAGVVVVIQPASVRDELDVPALAEQLVERAVGAFRRESQSGREIQIQIADASLVFANQVTGLVLSVIRELLILASLVSDTGPIQLGVGERKDGYMVAIFAQRRGLASETK